MDFQKITLPNGLRVITIPMKSVESATVMIMAGAGSRYEAATVCGLSHFLEHMTFKGTKKRPTAFEISSTLDGIGGEYNAFTGKEDVSFYVKALSFHLDLAFEILSDMVLNSRFLPEEIEREKGVIIEELNMYFDTPRSYVFSLWEQLLYGDHPLGWDVLGQKKTVKILRQEDFLTYLKKFYFPANLVVVVAGNVESRQVQELAQKYFGASLGPKKGSTYLAVIERQEKPQVHPHFKKTDQAHLCLGTRGFRLVHPRRYPFSLLSIILGGGMSSRLFVEVRERRGLAYYIHGLAQKYQDCGYFVAHAGVDLSRTEEAIKVILAEMAKMKEKLVEEKELKKVKEFWKGRMILELEDSREMASLFATQELLEERIETPQEIMKKIDKVTAQEVQQVAREIFVERKLNLAVIGPFRDGQKFEKLLHF